MNTEFIGGELAGQLRSPVNEDELVKLGYRPHLTSKPHGDELSFCYAVPMEWTPEDAHEAVMRKINADSPRRPGKRSI